MALCLRLNYSELSVVNSYSKQSTFIERPRWKNGSDSALSDITHVLGTLTSNDVINFLKSIILDDLFNKTIRRKFSGLFTSFKSLLKMGAKFIRRPVKSSLAIVDWLSKITLQVQLFWKDMSFDQKRNFIFRLISYIMFAAIGTYTGIQIPDMDISLWGIGSHRNFFTHSVAPAILIEFTYRVISRLMLGFKDRLPEHRKQYWNKSIKVTDDCLQSFVIGAYAGITFHIGKDLFIDGSQSIRGPWGNTFIKNTYFDDDLYLGINSALSAPSLMAFRESLND